MMPVIEPTTRPAPPTPNAISGRVMEEPFFSAGGGSVVPPPGGGTTAPSGNLSLLSFASALPPSATWNDCAVGLNPSADTLTVCVPGSTGRFSPSAATGTVCPSMVTTGAGGPSTVTTTFATRAETAGTSLFAASRASLNAGGGAATLLHSRM